ncbi:hypothetical protein EAX61_05845 [Dokdonia sinensis]|uniref:Selenophosphate synthetase n=1 Tax=Dokdonia sinensis TaxID=2479847 RepID=A0A3M0GHE1_9FLAO|nr:hypothetical protein [Dokdonia sinensis]RMB61003.1 hypothetical protein EAX61_05845 [Dokdonia sinensis]
MTKQLFLAIAALSILACKNDTTTTQNTEEAITATQKLAELTEAEKIAMKNGFENWRDVKQIDFTFNVDRGGKNVAQRSWSWKPQSGDVTMIQGEDKVTYNRASIDSTSMRADQGFINDKFWLLAPYQLVWDEGTTIKVSDTATAPLSGNKTKMLTITYGSDGGYTPGDAYDFYYDDDYIVDEWVFRKGNSEEPSMMTTFEGYQEFQGLNIATEHKDKEGNFKLYFTDIKVTK